MVMNGGISAIAHYPFVLHLHRTKLFCTEGGEKRDCHIVKSDCGKRSSHGECHNWGKGTPSLIPLLWDQSVEFVWNSVCESGTTAAEMLLCIFCCSEFRMKCAKVKIVIEMSLQLLRCFISPNASSCLSVACEMSS